MQETYSGHCFPALCQFFCYVTLCRTSHCDWRGKFQFISAVGHQILHSLGKCSVEMPDTSGYCIWTGSDANDLSHAPHLWWHSFLHPQGTAVSFHLEHIVLPFYLSLCPKWRTQMPVRPQSIAIRMATDWPTADPSQSALPPPTGQLLIMWPVVLNLIIRLPSFEPRQLFHWYGPVRKR